MLKGNGRTKGQSTLEYAVLIGVIAAALVGAQVYLNRAYQGKMKESADSLGEQFSARNTKSSYTTRSYTKSNETLKDGTTTTQILSQTSDRSGNETVGTADQERLPE